MSHGMGSACRRLLHAMDMEPGKWVQVVAIARSASDASSLRRAAHALERRGLADVSRFRGPDASWPAGTWLMARRRTEETLPDDLAVLVPKDEQPELLRRLAAATSLNEHDRILERIYQEQRDRLWLIALGSGLSMDVLAFCLKGMASQLGLERKAPETLNAHGGDGRRTGRRRAT